MLGLLADSSRGSVDFFGERDFIGFYRVRVIFQDGSALNADEYMRLK